MNFQAVLFDCDGVLVDSEPITNGVLRDMLEERGWVMSSEDCFRYFVGKAVKDHKAEIEARTGMPLTEEWLHAFRLRRNDALQAGLQVMPGAHEAVAAAYALLAHRVQTASK
jgi:beta-phosphoglucomutase-like phosphatase (HAD superfamily)